MKNQNLNSKSTVPASTKQKPKIMDTENTQQQLNEGDHSQKSNELTSTPVTSPSSQSNEKVWMSTVEQLIHMLKEKKGTFFFSSSLHTFNLFPISFNLFFVFKEHEIIIYEFHFPVDLCGRLIGRQGVHVDYIRQMTQVDLVVRDDAVSYEKQVVALHGILNKDFIQFFICKSRSSC